MVELEELPQSSAGAPCPVVLADEHHLLLAARGLHAYGAFEVKSRRGFAVWSG